MFYPPQRIQLLIHIGPIQIHNNDDSDASLAFASSAHGVHVPLWATAARGAARREAHRRQMCWRQRREDEHAKDAQEDAEKEEEINSNKREGGNPGFTLQCRMAAHL